MAVYQLAHETVHLLDQSGGDLTNILEEGVAVKFSLDVLKKYKFETTGLPSLETYKLALALVNLMGADPYSIAKACRASCSSFILIEEATLTAKYIGFDKAKIHELLKKTEMR